MGGGNVELEGFFVPMRDIPSYAGTLGAHEGIEIWRRPIAQTGWIRRHTKVENDGVSSTGGFRIHVARRDDCHLPTPRPEREDVRTTPRYMILANPRILSGFQLSYWNGAIGVKAHGDRDD